MTRKAAIIAGIPGTGKTTLMKHFIKGLSGPLEEVIFEGSELLPSMFASNHRLYIPGKYDSSDSVFQGTDKLSLAVQPHVEPFLDSIAGAPFVFEGDRIFTNATIDAILARYYDLKIFVLNVPEKELQRRYKERGSEQPEQFILGRNTKISRITSRLDLIMNEMIESRQHLSPDDTQKISEELMAHLFPLQNQALTVSS